MMKTEALQLVQEWDKTFPKSEKTDHRKVTFVNRYGITLAADMYTPRGRPANYRPLPSAVPLGQSRNSALACMRR